LVRFLDIFIHLYSETIDLHVLWLQQLYVVLTCIIRHALTTTTPNLHVFILLLEQTHIFFLSNFLQQISTRFKVSIMYYQEEKQSKIRKEEKIVKKISPKQIKNSISH